MSEEQNTEEILEQFRKIFERGKSGIPVETEVDSCEHQMTIVKHHEDKKLKFCMECDKLLGQILD